MSNFNWVDTVILAIFILSILAGLMRGLVKEVISLVTWIAAFVVASLFATRVAAAFTGNEQVQSAISNAVTSVGSSGSQSVSMVAIGCSFIGLFVATLIIGSILNYFISSAVESTGISFANRLLGAIFGLGRGFLSVLVIVFLVQLTPLQQQAWWGQSQLVPVFQPTAAWLDEIVQPGLQNLKSTVSDTLKNVDPNKYFQGAKDAFQKP